MSPESPSCDLVLLGEPADDRPWTLGRRVCCMPTAEAVGRAVVGLSGSEAATFVLTWDASLGPPPDTDLVATVIARRGDVWHAGLLLGQQGRPDWLDFVHPTWMLHADPRLDVPATSWRVSLRCCLAKADVWARLGGPRPSYDDLDIASLELGHRWLWSGAIVRHIPDLLSGVEMKSSAEPSRPEILRFLVHRVGRRWAAWALVRAMSLGLVGPMEAWRTWRAVAGEPRLDDPAPYRAEPSASLDASAAAVSVLIPTVDRYPWLDVLLDQLRRQTVEPLEILVVDQTAIDRRRVDWASFHDLPLRVLTREDPGQCSSRNAGLRLARGETVLFLDDDDEVEPDLIERHLETLAATRADASCGVADEVGAGPLPTAFRIRRVSDVFPTNNTMLRRAALHTSGLFDLAFETGARADADLGQRLYHAGALLVLDPSIRVLHHHAPSGGLRRHAARAVTYAESRRRVSIRHLPSATELYLARRHFSPRQAHEADVLRVAGTFALHGGKLRRLAKIMLSTAALPDTLERLRRHRRRAARMLERYPEIPRLDTEDGG